VSELRTLRALGRRWLYIDHGWREMRWSAHGNTEVVRWSLREYGVTLAGPSAAAGHSADSAGPRVGARHPGHTSGMWFSRHRPIGPAGPPTLRDTDEPPGVSGHHQGGWR
jgi:hypothetical protein